MSRKISELPCGAKIRFGSYCVKNEGAHSIRWIKVNDGDTTLLAEYIEDFRAFDAREPESSTTFRRDYGNNCYSVSNIDQFLNSTRENNWYIPQHSCDEPPIDNLTFNDTPYIVHPGFLAYFKKAEIEAIVPTNITVYLVENDRKDIDTKYEVISRRVFLPSITNIFGCPEGGVYEDQQWDYFKNGESTIAAPTVEATNYTSSDNKPEGKAKSWYYWLRTPKPHSSYRARYVSREGGWDSYFASGGLIGIRPALTINPETLVTDEPDEEGYYNTIIASAENDISEEDFLSTLLS